MVLIAYVDATGQVHERFKLTASVIAAKLGRKERGVRAALAGLHRRGLISSDRRGAKAPRRWLHDVLPVSQLSLGMGDDDLHERAGHDPCTSVQVSTTLDLHADAGVGCTSVHPRRREEGNNTLSTEEVVARAITDDDALDEGVEPTAAERAVQELVDLFASIPRTSLAFRLCPVDRVAVEQFVVSFPDLDHVDVARAVIARATGETAERLNAGRMLFWEARDRTRASRPSTGRGDSTPAARRFVPTEPVDEDAIYARSAREVAGVTPWEDS